VARGHIGGKAADQWSGIGPLSDSIERGINGVEEVRAKTRPFALEPSAPQKTQRRGSARALIWLSCLSESDGPTRQGVSVLLLLA
jgi:hypothetical protein